MGRARAISLASFPGSPEREINKRGEPGNVNAKILAGKKFGDCV